MTALLLTISQDIATVIRVLLQPLLRFRPEVSLRCYIIDIRQQKNATEAALHSASTFSLLLEETKGDLYQPRLFHTSFILMIKVTTNRLQSKFLPIRINPKDYYHYSSAFRTRHATAYPFLI